MGLYVKNTNIEIIGTLEVVNGVALTTGIDKDGSPIYLGYTQINWDGQRTIEKDGERIWVDNAGDEYPQSLVEQREETTL